jgi:uncharacterized protein with PhoU and TrkA domain
VDEDRALQEGDLLVARGTGEGVDLFRSVALGEKTIREVLDIG